MRFEDLPCPPEGAICHAPALPPDADLPVSMDAVNCGLPLLVVVSGLRRDERQFIPLTIGDNLAEVLMATSPDRWGGSGISLFRNCLSRDTQIDTNTAPDIIVTEHDLFIAYVGMADPMAAGIVAAVVIGGAAALTIGLPIGLAIGAVVLGGMLVGMFLLEQPKLRTPESPGDQGSGRGTLGIPRNQARLGSRIPDIFGFNRTWPDLIAPPVDFYNGADYSVTILYCLGIGHFETAQPRFGDTDTSKFPNVSVSIIQPEAVPFSYSVLFTAEQAKGFRLRDPTPVIQWSPWVELPGTNMTQIWIDVAFPGGLIQYRTGGDPDSQWVDMRAEYRRVLSPGVFGAVTTVNWRIQDNFNGSLRYTKILPEGGGSLTPGTYEVRAARIAKQTTVDNIHVDDCEIARFASYKNGTVTHKLFNVPRTYISVGIQSSRQTGQSSFEDFNIICSRFYLTLDVNSWGPWQPTRRWCDALAHMLLDPFTGGYVFDDLDRAEILNVQLAGNLMDGGLGGQFNHIYDRFLDVDEQLQSCANALRAAVVQDYGQVTVVRDGLKAFISALITPQNRSISDEGSKTISFLSPDENDGVEMEWFDSSADFVRRTYRYPNTTLFNPRKVEVVGLTNWSQVWRRAKYEHLKQTRRRRTNTITTFEEGLLLLPMDLIEVVEMWDTTRVSEIVLYQVSGTPYATFVDVQPKIDVNPDDFAVISSRDGQQVDSIGIFADTAVATNRIFLERGVAFPIAVMGEAGPTSIGGKVQAGSRIAIYNSDRHLANRWLVGTIKPGDGKCTVTLLEYDTEIYRGDTDALPPNTTPR